MALGMIGQIIETLGAMALFVLAALVAVAVIERIILGIANVGED